MWKTWIVSLFMIFLLALSSLPEFFDARGRDLITRITSDQQRIDSSIVYAVITQGCLDWASELGYGWPWPREFYAGLVKYLEADSARHIYFDFIFSESSSFGMEDDQAFQAALNHFHEHVSLGFVLDSGMIAKNDTLYRRYGITIINHSASGFPVYTGYQPLAAIIDQSLTSVGAVNFVNDPDGINRRAYPLFELNGTLCPSLTFAGFWYGSGRAELERESDALRIGNRRMPLNRDGSVNLRYYGPFDAYPVYPLRTVMSAYIKQMVEQLPEESPIPPGFFRGKSVFIGSTAPGLKDLRPNPFHSLDPGVHIHGTFYNNLVNFDFSRKVDSWLYTGLVVLGLALLGCILVNERHILWSMTGFVASLAFLALFFILAYRYINLIFPYTLYVSAILFGYIDQTMVAYYRQKRQKQFIQSAFSQLVSPVIMKDLIIHPEKLNVGGKSVEASVFFSDIADFTTLSEKITPAELIQLLNIYLDDVTKVIVEDNQGYIDKFIGDAVMAFWGAPVANPDHARLACSSAITIQKEMPKINRKLNEKGFPFQLKVRIGITSGEVVAGMMGSSKKLNYTVLGDRVNLASRLEGINKYYNTWITTGEETIRLLDRSFTARELDRIQVKGKSEPTRIYQLVGLTEDLSNEIRERLEMFGEALALYYRGEFERARFGFDRIAVDDPPAVVFKSRCETLITRPPDSWNGVFTFTTK